MTTFLSVFFGGVISALVTLLLGQPLQHYFWRRQRHADRQLTTINDLCTLAAELQHLVLHQPEEITPRRERLYIALYRVTTDVGSLFSEAALTQFRPALRSMEAILSMEQPSPLEQRIKLCDQSGATTMEALDDLYRDMGIPPQRPWRWLRKRVGSHFAP